jgi:hypothetical protein
LSSPLVDDSVDGTYSNRLAPLTSTTASSWAFGVRQEPFTFYQKGTFHVFLENAQRWGQVLVFWSVEVSTYSLFLFARIMNLLLVSHRATSGARMLPFPKLPSRMVGSHTYQGLPTPTTSLPTFNPCLVPRRMVSATAMVGCDTATLPQTDGLLTQQFKAPLLAATQRSVTLRLVNRKNASVQLGVH